MKDNHHKHSWHMPGSNVARLDSVKKLRQAMLQWQNGRQKAGVALQEEWLTALVQINLALDHAYRSLRSGRLASSQEEKTIREIQALEDHRFKLISQLDADGPDSIVEYNTLLLHVV